MNVHHPRGEAIKSTAIACLAAHWQYSFVSFNSSLTNTPVVFCSETAISLQNHTFQTGLSMLTLERDIYPNFRQELGKKSGEEGAGTDDETQQFEQKRSQDVALTRTYTIFLLIDCFPSAEGDEMLQESARPGTQSTRVSPRRTEPGRERVPAAGLLRAAAASAARTRRPPRPLCSKRPPSDPRPLQRDPCPVSCPPRPLRAGRAVLEPAPGKLWGCSHPRALACRPPNPRGRAAGRPFPLPKCRILCG